MSLVFVLTAALSAFLLFLVQPLIAKPMLPVLGGSPSVWISCMLTFQLLLLFGYGYAYASSRSLTVRRQSILHLALLSGSFLLLPFALRAARFDALDHPQLWLMATLLHSVGGPYFLLASSAPMLQRWAANTSLPLANNPYPLYAASNAGSLLGLLAYPLVVEPSFTTPQQFDILTAGYVSLVLGFAGCAMLLQWYLRRPAVGSVPTPPLSAGNAPLGRWLVYSAIPASLLFGTTTFIVSDIASVPLLWILPLMLYISSFIVAFSDRQWRIQHLRRAYFPLGLLTLFCVAFEVLAGRVGITPIMVIAITLSTLFIASILFHRRLYELRPKVEDSGLFYVVLALGGALGGCFNSLVAPRIFVTAAEFPLVLALSLLIVLPPDFLSAQQPRSRTVPARAVVLLVLSLVAAGLYASSVADPFAGWYLGGSGVLVLLIVFSALLVSDWLFRTPTRALLAILVGGLLAIYVGGASRGSWLYAERNFFGISRVGEDVKLARRFYIHGVTLHGVQSTDPAHRLDPTSYFGVLRDVFAHLPPDARDAPIGAVGLGVGTVACYAKAAQEMDFYEIDPASIHIATDPAYFTYMSECPGQRNIVVGDGRINLSKAPDGRYGIIIMDAFTSDAIPMHLLTLEAMGIYGRKLRPDGLMAFNISNRYLDLLPVFRTLSDELGWAARYRYNVASAGSLELPSIWVVLAKNAGSIAPLDQSGLWKTLPPEHGNLYRWTDGYTNLLGILHFTPAWISALSK